MNPHWDNEPLSRREWEEWKRDVYSYRHQELEKEIANIMSVLNRLSSIVDKAEHVTQNAARISESMVVRLGVAGAIIAPTLAVIIEHVWK